MVSIGLCNELPFSSLSDESLISTLTSDASLSNGNHYRNLEFDPWCVDDFKYNNDADVNRFIVRDTLVRVPKTNYVFADELPLSCNNNLTICNMNIRSIPKNLQSFRDTILCNTILDITVLGFTEVRLDPNYVSLYELPGYIMYNNCRNVHGGGVSIYASSEYDSSIVNHLVKSESYIETVGVELTIGKNKCLFICIYRPPNGNFQNFLTTMTNILSSLYEKTYHNIFIMGDFNINLLKEYDTYVLEFTNLMFSFSLYPFITKPTRVTSTSASLIDHIWATHLEGNTGNYIVETDISDHYPILSQFKFDNVKQIPQYIYRRTITRLSLDKFVSDLALVNWNSILHLTCCEEAYDLFYEEFYELFQKHFPIKKICLSKKNECSPYITPALKISIREKHRLERLYRRWPVTYERTYKQYRNKLTSTLRTAKNKYYKTQLNDNQGNARKQWKTINSILGRASDVCGRKIELNTPCTDISGMFNEHFLKNNLTVNDHDFDFAEYLNNPQNFSMYLNPAKISEVETILKNLKTNTPGYDDISPKILKHSSSVISTPLTHIINLSLKTGTFPDQLKKAKVVPLLKSGDRGDINNYRPISILPAFSKIFEKIISVRLINYVESNNLIIAQQHGFRAQRSTESAILDFVNDVYLCLEQKSYVVGVFIDLSKAFDTLDHKILLHKLENYGIRGVVLKLFHSYLSNRKQSVFCNNAYSPFKEIVNGVPQGSVLGPLLFLLYINDFINVSDKFNFVIYADDTTLLLKDKNLHSLHTNLISELNKVKLWIKFNKLSLNISKTKYMLFQNRSVKNSIPPVTLNDTVIEHVNYIKFLGITVDDNLNWKRHIDLTCTKLSKVTGVLYRIRHNLTIEAMISIYYTLCYPHLTYCVSVWASTWPTFLNRLNILQNKVIRCMFFL